MAFEQQPLELNDDFKYALDQIEKAGNNLFITGRAGTGKSTLLQLFRNTTRKKTVVLAPTGIAALNVKGQTIHSFFGFPPRPISKRDIKRRRNRRLYKNMEVLVIDEISMVRADMLDNIDYFLKVNRESYAPFGGVQVVFFGDLFQLPPVVASDAERSLFEMRYETPYFFSSDIFEDESFQMEMIELHKVYRQDNRHFLSLLEAIRMNEMDYDILDELNQQVNTKFDPPPFFITLTATNATANRINQKKLQQIPFPAQKYQAKVKGDFNPRVYPTEAVLSLKLGAQVMFIKNDPERAFVNGTIGKVTDLKNDTIVIEIEDAQGVSKKIETGMVDWEILKYKPSEKDLNKIETEIVGTFSQFPVKLAWGITIHKSQGKTFDKIVVDLGRGAFEHGQTYVALSRCRTLEGIVLKTPLRFSDIKTDERVVDFYRRCS